jgi:hypothetical protein
MRARMMCLDSRTALLVDTKQDFIAILERNLNTDLKYVALFTA